MTASVMPAPAAPARSSSSAIPYVAPFVAFMVMLVLGPQLTFLGKSEFLIRNVLLAGVIWITSRRVLDFRVKSPGLTIALGIGVFAIWIAPDLLIPGWRSSPVFQNSITGSLHSSIDPALRDDRFVLVMRSIRAMLLVPIIEELFWRGWLMRWVINPHFSEVPLGAYTARAMWITALLFASEHGPYWEVGLIAGLAYNWLMVRTKSLGDCMAAHAITNGVLSLFVVLSGKWEYWL